MKRTLKTGLLIAAAFLLISAGTVLCLLKPWNTDSKARESEETVPVVEEQNNGVAFDPNDYSYGKAAGERYTNSKYIDLSFVFPPEWVGKYVVTEKEDLVLVRQMAAAELYPQDDTYGTLFTIRLFHSGDAWQKDGVRLENMFVAYKIGEKKDVYAAFQLPKEAGVKASDGWTVTAEYQELLQNIYWLMDEGGKFGFDNENAAEGIPLWQLDNYQDFYIPLILPIQKGGRIESKTDENSRMEAVYTSPDGETVEISNCSINLIGEGLFSAGFSNGPNSHIIIAIDAEGTVLTDAIYNYVGEFAEGRFLCATGKESPEGWMPVYGGKYGFINSKWQEVIPLQYDAAWQFSDGLAYVGKDGKSFFIDTNGEKVFDLSYDMVFISGERYNYQFREGLLPVADGEVWKDGKMGYIDKTGKVVIGFDWGCALSFSDGVAPVAETGGKWYGSGEGSSYGGKWGLIDRTGKLVVAPQYGGIKEIGKGLFSVRYYVKEDDRNNYSPSEGLIDKTGKLLLPIEYDYIELTSSDNGVTLKCIKSYQQFEYYTYKDGKLTKIPQG